MNHQKLATSKLFYGKWPYKILCIVKESWRIKRMGVKNTIEYCYNPRNNFYSNKWRGEPLDLSTLLKFTGAMEPFLNKELQIRAEGNLFNIYCKDQELYQTMVNDLDEFIREIHEPESLQEFEYIVSNSAKKILCNKFPYNKYQYRIWLKHSIDISTKHKFDQWIVNYGDQIKPTKSTQGWLKNEVRFWSDQPNIYIKDATMLSMVSLYLGSNIKKIEEYIPRSDINISLQQENTCQL